MVCEYKAAHLFGWRYRLLKWTWLLHFTSVSFRHSGWLTVDWNSPPSQTGSTAPSTERHLRSVSKQQRSSPHQLMSRLVPRCQLMPGWRSWQPWVEMGFHYLPSFPRVWAQGGRKRVLEETHCLPWKNTLWYTWSATYVPNVLPSVFTWHPQIKWITIVNWSIPACGCDSWTETLGKEVD